MRVSKVPHTRIGRALRSITDCGALPFCVLVFCSSDGVVDAGFGVWLLVSLGSYVPLLNGAGGVTCLVIPPTGCPLVCRGGGVGLGGGVGVAGDVADAAS